MSDTRRSRPEVLAVGIGPAVTETLASGQITVTAVSDGGKALSHLTDRSVGCLVVGADAGGFTGIELALVVRERHGVPAVVVGDDVPSRAADAAGVSAVCPPADPDRVADIVQRTIGSGRDSALSAETIDALESLYELDDSVTVEQWLEGVVAIGCRRLGLPYGFVTSIDDDTQHVVAAVGDHDQLQAGSSAPLSAAYCEYTVQNDEVVGFGDVSDADWVDDGAYERFGLACYLGGRVDLGDRYGTICFADDDSRAGSFSAEERTFVKLLTQWVRYELSQRDSRSELRLKNRVMDEAEIGITISDPSLPDNPVVYANDGFERVTGYSPEYVVGRNCRFLQGENTDPEAVRRMRDAIDAGESVTAELCNYRKDGTAFWNRVQIQPVTVDGEVTNFVGFQRDITERKEREQELLGYEAALETAADSIYRLDTEDRFEMVNDAVPSMTGYDREALLGAGLDRLLSPEDVERTQRCIADALRCGESEVVTLTVTVERRDGTTFPAESRIAPVTEDGDHRGTVMVTRDISDRRAHERTLTELHDASPALLGAESSTEVSDIVAAAADEILDIEAVGVYRFDETENRLYPDSVPEAAKAVVGDPPTFGPGDGIAWRTFMAGERRVYDDVTADPDVYNPETELRSELLLPIGDHGLLLCGAVETAAYDQRTAELADLLAASAQAAYDRMERDRRLQRRERELREQNRRLERIDAVNERLRRVAHDLVGATTRDEIATIVCEGVAEIDSYRFVHAGEFDHIDDRVTVDATAGASTGYLDTVSLAPSADGPEPTVAAATGSEPVVYNTVADGLRSGEWQRAALNRDYRAVASFPLRHNNVPYGALSVYATDADAFDEETSELLADFAGTVAHSLAAVEQRQALLGDQQVQLVFGMAAQPTTLFQFARTLSAPVTVHRVVPRSDGGSLVYGVAEGVSAATVEACARESHDLTALEATAVDGGVRFELHVTGPCLAGPVADHGGMFEALHVETDRGRLVVTFSSTKRVSEFTRLLTSQYEGVELLARREHGEPSPAGLADELTDRQREVLAVAHERGFYDWPRESTGEDIADSLDIAAPTFLEHLRRAEAKLVERAIDRGDIGPS